MFQNNLVKFWAIVVYKSTSTRVTSLGSPIECKSVTYSLLLGSGCGTVDSAVASETREPGVKSSHQHLLLNKYLLLTVFFSKKRSLDVVLGIRTRGRRMVGAYETTELWRPPNYLTNYCQLFEEKTKIKKKRPGIAHLNILLSVPNGKCTGPIYNLDQHCPTSLCCTGE